jgi:hypothetical protein
MAAAFNLTLVPLIKGSHMVLWETFERTLPCAGFWHLRPIIESLAIMLFSALLLIPPRLPA